MDEAWDERVAGFCVSHGLVFNAEIDAVRRTKAYAEARYQWEHHASDSVLDMALAGAVSEARSGERDMKTTQTEAEREQTPKPVKHTTTTFEIYRARDGWRWRAKRANGRIVADSGEAYTRKNDAHRAAFNFVAVVDRENIRWVIDEK